MIPSKKEKIVIVGGGGHAKVLKSIVDKLDDYEYLGFTDIVDNGQLPKYLGTDDYLLNNINNEIFNLVIGISYIKNVVYDSIRKTLIRKFTLDNKFNFPAIISKNSFVDNNVIIKKGSVVINGATINTDTLIEEFCIINTNSSIDHDCTIGFNTQVSPGVTILGGVKIGSNVFIGAGSTILDGLKIVDNVIIGAGSLVTKDILESGVYVGSPAKKIK